jgi:protein-tyrosine phosphatase
MLSPGLPRRLGDGEPSTLAGSRAVLTELPFVGWPAFTETTLFELHLAGFHPVLAHPERYVAVQEKPELALEAGSRGTVLQLTTGSFAGVYGRTVERSAFRLLEAAIDRDIPVLLSTDAHSEGQRLALVPAGIDRIRKQVADGGSVVAWASRAVPEALLANRAVAGFAEWYALHPDQDAAVDPVAANGSTGHRGRAGRLRQALRLGSSNRS